MQGGSTCKTLTLQSEVVPGTLPENNMMPENHCFAFWDGILFTEAIKLGETLKKAAV